MVGAVVILNWNKADLTRRCLRVARGGTGLPLHWIVVDNGSAEPVGDCGPGVTVLRNKENLGFAGGVNTGLSHAIAQGAAHILLLNNDAEPRPGAIDRLFAAGQADPGIGLASAVILNSDEGDQIDFHGGRWSDGSYFTTRSPNEYAAWLKQDPGTIWLLGTALLVSAALVKRAGLFDERLFAYYEDNDFSRRSAAAGFRNVVVPDALVSHSGGTPILNPAERPPYYFYYMTRNELLLMRKMRDSPAIRLYYWMLLRTARVYRRLAGLPKHRRALRRGLWHGVLGVAGPYRD